MFPHNFRKEKKLIYFLTSACGIEYENTPWPPRANSIWKYSLTTACDIEFENTLWPLLGALYLKILLDPRMQHWIWKNSLTPVATLNLKLVLDLACDIKFENTPWPQSANSILKYYSTLVSKFILKILFDPRVQNSILKYFLTSAFAIEFENTLLPKQAKFNLKILFNPCVRQWIWKYSLTPA